MFATDPGLGCPFVEAAQYPAAVDEIALEERGHCGRVEGSEDVGDIGIVLLPRLGQRDRPEPDGGEKVEIVGRGPRQADELGIGRERRAELRVIPAGAWWHGLVREDEARRLRGWALVGAEQALLDERPGATSAVSAPRIVMACTNAAAVNDGDNDRLEVTQALRALVDSTWIAILMTPFMAA